MAARRDQLGYICLSGDDRLIWLGRRGFRVRSHPIDLAAVNQVGVRDGFLFEELFLRSGPRTVRLRFTRDRRRVLEALARRLEARREAAAPTAA